MTNHGPPRPHRLGVVIMVFALLASCSVISPERPHGPVELATLKVAVTRAIDTAPLRLAVKREMFERSGLTVTLVEQPSQRRSLKALWSDTVDVAFTGNVTVLKEVANGADVRIQSEAYIAGPDTMGLVTLPGSGYDGPTAKVAPRIAVDTLGGLGTLTTRSRMATEGIDPDAIQFTAMPFGAMMDALRRGEIDAAWLTEPDISRAQQEFGARIMTDTARGAMLDFPMSSYVTTGKAATKHPTTFAVFREVLTKAQQLAADPTEVRDVLASFSFLDKTAATLVALGTFPTSVNAVRLQRVADLMHDCGLVRKRIDVSSLVPNSATRGG
ncbi:ABC transporter substrate-binding protein [Haloechinothrix salitolerans]|uniref:ABC transporter substrate-binding protein n=1 Tax=Haloechinothrix salitolerans TaxID=926830 RepID=A0ABW2BUG5_9PSEU